jgi:hypothetical protein
MGARVKAKGGKQCRPNGGSSKIKNVVPRSFSLKALSGLEKVRQIFIYFKSPPHANGV